MDRLGIDFITVLGMPPVEFVNLAGDLGCRYIAIAAAQIFGSPVGYPAWSLREDRALRRDMAAAMRDRGVSLSTAEGFMVRPGADIRDSAADLDAICELGAPRINMISIDPDQTRSFDQFAILVEMAEKRGLESTVEFAPIMMIPDLAAACAAIRHVGRPSFRLLIDTLHVARSGLSAKDLAALDPALIGYIQLCDAPLAFTQDSYIHEASVERMAPGDGELPLLDILAALPRDLVVGLEIPMLKDAQAGVDPHRRVGRCVEAARKLLARLDRQS